LLRIQGRLLGLGLQLRVEGRALGGIFGVDDPARQRERHGPGESLGVLAYGHRHPHQLLLILLGRFDGAQPIAVLIQRLAAHRAQIDRAGRHLVHFRFGIQLGGRQVASHGRVACADPDQLAQRGQGAAEDGDGEDHL
jgi:hypothetical protein